MFEKYDAYKDSGESWIGLIPKHWEIIKLKHLLLIKKIIILEYNLLFLSILTLLINSS